MEQRGQYGFKIKLSVKKQKSLTDRRIRGPNKVKPPSVQVEKVPDAVEPTATLAVPQSAVLTAGMNTTTKMTAQEINAFQEMLKESLAMDRTG